MIAVVQISSFVAAKPFLLNCRPQNIKYFILVISFESTDIPVPNRRKLAIIFFDIENNVQRRNGVTLCDPGWREERTHA
jgi:hypothetical protein